MIAIARLFGFVRVTEEAREGILEAIEMALTAQRLQKEGEVLKMV